MSLIKSASRSSVVTLVLALGGPDDGVSVGGAASNCSSDGVGAGVVSEEEEEEGEESDGEGDGDDGGDGDRP